MNPRTASAKRSMGNLLASSTSGRRRPRRPNLEPRSAIRFLKECGKNHRTSPGAVPPRTRASHSHHPSRGGAAARQNGAESGGASKWRRELSAYGPRVCVVCRLVPIFKAGDTKLNILNIHSRQSANHHNLIWKGENAVVVFHSNSPASFRPSTQIILGTSEDIQLSSTCLYSPHLHSRTSGVMNVIVFNCEHGNFRITI